MAAGKRSRRKSVLTVETAAGTAQVDLDLPADPRAVLMLGHGAGGGVDARDLVAVRDAACLAGYAVARTTQPYRLAGRRAPAPAPKLDVTFEAMAEALITRRRFAGLPLITGGRSSGARVACRTAATVGAVGVVALAFPLHPPGKPERSRASELLDVEVPTLVLQGERDPFGGPGEFRALDLPITIDLRTLPGADHGFAVRKADPPVVELAAKTAVDWLRRLVG